MPLGLVLSSGTRHDSTQLEPVLDAISVPRRRGRPRKRPGLLIADKAYSGGPCRALLRRRGIPHVIPQPRIPHTQKRKRLGRPTRFDKALYAQRYLVERAILQLKGFRRIATRYEKRAVNFLAMVHIAAILMWINYLSDTV